MSTGRRIWAYAVAAVGSAGLIVSLWLPWYSFRIPGFAIDQAEQVGQQFGILAPLIRQPTWPAIRFGRAARNAVARLDTRAVVTFRLDSAVGGAR